LQLQISTIVLH